MKLEDKPNRYRKALRSDPAVSFTMGCGQSKLDVEDKEAFQQNAKIDKMLRHDKKQDARTVKILLLGT